MVELKKRLKEKGWPEDIAHKTSEILSSKEMQDKHAHFGKTMTGVLFWIALMVLTISMIGIALFLIPFLMVITNYFIHFIIMALGIVFGLIFVFLINDIEALDRPKHILAALYVPIMAVAFLFISVTVSKRLDQLFGYQITTSPWIVSIVFVITFMIPYFIDLARKRKSL